MKFIYCVILCFLGKAVIASEYMPLDPKKSHLDFNLEKGPFNLKFFSDNNVNGDPVIVLNEKGLFISGKQVCDWPGKLFDPNKSFNMVLIDRDSKTDCRKAKAIRSTWGDGGTGTAVLTIEVLKFEKDSATISNQNTQLTLPLKDFRGKFKLTSPGELSNKVGD